MCSVILITARLKNISNIYPTFDSINLMSDVKYNQEKTIWTPDELFVDWWHMVSKAFTHIETNEMPLVNGAQSFAPNEAHGHRHQLAAT